MSSLHPYSGQRLEIHSGIGKPSTRTNYCSDQSGTIEYEFNSLGFRGPEFDPDADFIVFLFGESDGFGLGVEFEEIWSVQVAREMAKRKGYSKEQTCIMCFAESGVSNTFIARMLVSQCTAVRPDLVLAHFAEDRRTELIGGGNGWSCGAWLSSPDLDEQIRQADGVTAAIRENLGEVLRRGRSFLDHSTPRQSLYRSLRELLLLQEFTAALQLPTICIAADAHRFFAKSLQSDPQLGPLAKTLSPDFLHCLPLAQLLADDHEAFDDFHLSARSHSTIAAHILNPTPRTP